MTDPRDLIQRLADALDNAIRVIYHKDGTEHIDTAMPALFEARAYLATPEPAAGPTDEELWEVYDKKGGNPYDWPWVLAFARAVLARYRHQPPHPIPLSERLPGPEDCDAEGRCWFFGVDPSRSHITSWDLLTAVVFEQYPPTGLTHWLPHHALPLPEVEP